MHTHTFTTQLANYQRFDNGVRLTFISPKKSHKNALKASVSITLSKGHYFANDFPEGFAHLYEHMLFNASTRYKNTDALDKHLFAFHGQVNGWTQDFSTNFQMNCDQTGFFKACEILMDRLSAPLFRLKDIDAEITAIDAEFISKASDPVRQLLSVQKATSNPRHPFSRFSAGNKSTLTKLSAKKTQTLLRDYHIRVMQGQHISICVGLPRCADAENKKLALQALFSATLGAISIKNRLESVPELPPVYLPSQLNCLLNVQQNTGRHQLISIYTLTKPACNNFSSQRNSLYIMICHLLESKHQHGLFWALKASHLALDIHSYYKSIDLQTDELVISIQLSEKGSARVSEVYLLVQTYIDFLSKKGIEPWRFREKASQYALSLHTNKGSSLLEDCIEVSQGMNATNTSWNTFDDKDNTTFSLENLTGSAISADEPWLYLPETFTKLVANNTRVYFISPSAINQTPNSRTTKHFNTPYSVSKLLESSSSQQIDIPNFTKPRKNPYVTSEHALVKAQLPPTKLLHILSAQCNFKFYQDLSFNLPNGECYISITEPEMYKTVKQSAAKRVWLACLNEFLASEFFDVELASIHFRVYAHHHGICIHTGGLSERQLLLCIEMINAIRTYKADVDNIKHHLANIQNMMQNRVQQRPLNQLFMQLNEYYQNDSKKQSAILDSMLSVSAQEIYEIQNSYFHYNYIECLLVGNWHVDAAKHFHHQINNRFDVAHALKKPKACVPLITKGKHIHRRVEETQENHLVWHFIPLVGEHEKALARKDSRMKLRLAARSLVLEKLLSHIMFEELRQQQKIAYELGVGYKPISTYPGIAMYVVSSTHSIAEIYDAQLTVIKKATNMLTSHMVSLQEIVNELIKQVSPRDTDLSQTANRAWLHFDDENPILGFKDLITALNLLDLKEILDALENLESSSLGQVLLTSSAKMGSVLLFT